MAKTLYICYFGMREPLVQTQVLPYLRELLKDGHKIHLLTFEPDLSKKWSAAEISEMQNALRNEGIEWNCLAYHKRPSALATAYDIFRGALFVRKAAREKDLDIMHARIHVPMLMAALARKFSGNKPKLLFDIRGFFPEEYTDAGVWKPDGFMYKLVKRTEKWLMKEADGFVVLTEKARDILFPESPAAPTTPAFGHPSSGGRGAGGSDADGRPVEVVPCCVDFRNRFDGDRGELRQRKRAELGVSDRFVITHLGSLGGLYLTREIADLLAVARSKDPSTFALFLTQSDPGSIVPLLNSAGFTNCDYIVRRVSPEEVPAYLCASDIGLSFVKAGYATLSRSPTKIPEYLACGVPLVANRGVGDVDKLIVEYGVGVLVDDLSAASCADALDRINAADVTAEQCIAAAHKEFDLERVGGERYRRLYSRLVVGN